MTEHSSIAKGEELGEDADVIHGLGPQVEDAESKLSSSSKVSSLAGDSHYEAILNSIKKTANGNNRLTLLVPDIRCANCALSIEDKVSRIPGVQSCRASAAEHRVTLEYQDTPPEQLLDSLSELGYQPYLDRNDQVEAVYREQKKNLLGRIGVAGIGMMQVMMYALAAYLAGDQGMDKDYETLMRWAALFIAAPVALYSALPFHRGAWQDLKHGRPGMDVPVSLAILAAFTLSAWETLAQGDHVYFDSVCMFTFFLLIGRYLELNSRHGYHLSQNLAENLLPVSALILEGDTKKRVALEEIGIGSRIFVPKGEVIPLDGRVLEGLSSIDESAFTGEAMPVTRSPGQKVLAGSTNLEADLIIEVGAEKENLVISKISQLFQESVLYKPKFSILADKVARYFVSGILLLSVCSGFYWYLSGAENWMVVSLTVLVVSCPCALSLATPIAYTVAASALRNAGVVLSNGSFLERLAEVDSVVFDKTGTLTSGDLKVSQIQPFEDADSLEPLNSLELPDSLGSPNSLEPLDSLEPQINNYLHIAAALEAQSPHPIAKAFAILTDLHAENLEAIPGQGISGKINGKEYRIGKPGFVLGKSLSPPKGPLYWILLGDEKPLCWFGLSDKLRPESTDAIKRLRKAVTHLAIFTGDSSESVAGLATDVHIEHFQKGMSPEDKLASLMDLQSRGHRVLMVGDGINDTGAMGVADASIAVSPVDVFVQSAADVTMLNHNLQTIPALIVFSRKVRRVIRQNIGWALLYNLSVIPLAVAGYLLPWMAALGMSISSLVVVFNGNRVHRVKI